MTSFTVYEELKDIAVGAYVAGKCGEPIDWLIDAQAQWLKATKDKDNKKRQHVGVRCFELLLEAYDAGREAAKCD